MATLTDAQTFRAGAGQLRMQVHSPRLMSTVFRGTFDADLVEPFERISDAWIAQSGERLHAFHDWEAMENYDMRVRVALTKWAVRHRPRFEGIEFLLRSPVVRAGVEVANFALGRFMRTHASRPTFEARFRQALATDGVRTTR